MLTVISNTFTAVCFPSLTLPFLPLVSLTVSELSAFFVDLVSILRIVYAHCHLSSRGFELADRDNRKRHSQRARLR